MYSTLKHNSVNILSRPPLHREIKQVMQEHKILVTVSEILTNKQKKKKEKRKKEKVA